MNLTNPVLNPKFFVYSMAILFCTFPYLLDEMIRNDLVFVVEY